MLTANAIDTLNRLLDAEYAGVVNQLGEASPYASGAANAARTCFENVVQTTHRHQRRLIEAIQALGGSPVCARRTIDTANLHYVELSYLASRIEEGLQSLVESYESAGSTGVPEADAIISPHLQAYRDHLSAWRGE